MHQKAKPIIALSASAALVLTSFAMVGCSTANQSSSSQPTQQETQTETQKRTNTWAPEGMMTDKVYYDGVAAESELDGGYYYEDVDWNTESYSDIDKNESFILTSSKPFSTFSADVDTASYCNFRRLVNESVDGKLPEGALRTEEMVNYFDYSYDTPKKGDLFGVTTKIVDTPWNDQTKLLVMGLKTEDNKITKDDGNNFVFLIDVSGSMDSRDKLPLLKKSFYHLLDNMNAGDKVSIVTYSGNEKVELEGADAVEDRDKILSTIQDLEAEGSTNGQSGLEMAYKIAKENYIENGNNRIIMASDGDLNVGMTSNGDLKDYVAEKREEGTYLSVLGFGTGNYKDDKMETIADNGNGNYFYIDSEEEAEHIFSDKLMSSMHTVADDVKMQVEFNPAYVKAYRQIGYENRKMADEDFNNDKVDAAELGSGTTVTVAYELVMTDSEMELPSIDSKYSSDEAKGVENGEWLTLNIKYKAPHEDTSTEEEHSYGEKAYDKSGKMDSDLAFAAAVMEFSMLENDIPNMPDASLDHVLSQLKDKDVVNNNQRIEFRNLLKHLQELRGEGVV